MHLITIRRYLSQTFSKTDRFTALDLDILLDIGTSIDSGLKPELPVKAHDR